MLILSVIWGRWRQAQTGYPTLAKCWDAGKSRIKGITVAYCSQKAKRESSTRDLLTRLASHLKSRVDAGFVACMAPYRSTLAQLERLDVVAARGAQVRSRSRWVEDGESSSAFFLRQERRSGVDRRISALRQENGSIVSSPKDSVVLSVPFILLYSPLSQLMLTLKILFEAMESSLSDEQAEACEGRLSSEECYTALKVYIAHNKAPGIDGLSMNFMLSSGLFWVLISFSSELSFSSGSLPVCAEVLSPSLSKKVIAWTQKLASITLLNVDYKIAKGFGGASSSSHPCCGCAGSDLWGPGWIYRRERLLPP